jgi:uncharacterized protein (DUF58 family)
MTLPVTTFLDPKTLARIGNLELIARVVVEGFLNGLHRSPHLGTSMDFAEHRGYMPGDDIRRIDWRLYARSDRYYIKEFEADTNTNVSVILDISRSMSYASGGKTALSKLDYGKYLAACLLFFCQSQRDRVGLVTIDDDVRAYVPPSAKHLPVALHTLQRATPGAAGNLEAPLRKLAEQFRRRSIVILISDFYEEPQRVVDAMAHLRSRGNDLIAFHLLDAAELEFPFDGATSFEDLETGEQIPLIPELLRDQYRQAIADHIAALTKLTGERGIDYALFDTSKPLDFALFDFLSRRERLSKVR